MVVDSRHIGARHIGDVSAGDGVQVLALGVLRLKPRLRANPVDTSFSVEMAQAVEQAAALLAPFNAQDFAEIVQQTMVDV
ncbi:MAG: hypothetical protein ACI9MC_001033 [Kiritimatiellia bacterium]